MEGWAEPVGTDVCPCYVVMLERKCVGSDCPIQYNVSRLQKACGMF